MQRSVDKKINVMRCYAGRTIAFADNFFKMYLDWHDDSIGDKSVSFLPKTLYPCFQGKRYAD